MKPVIFLLLCAISAGATTIENDDSCDIALLPAATLLLPYFEVDLDDANGETTLFTVTNVTNLDQIAHVTLWTDYGFPVIDFNIFLTGYDVQAINLFDVFVRGVIAPSKGTGTEIHKRGTWSDPNPAIRVSWCDRLPGQLDPIYVTRMQHAFTRGSVPPFGAAPPCATVGGVHENAVGYATIDAARICSTSLPTDSIYWADEISFDNVLIGDYQQVNGRESSAQGGAMVHIRAIPEGQAVRTPSPNDLLNPGFERTFYGRYQSAATPRLDRRQPLPSTFATRWISGGPSDFATSLKVWREGRTDVSTACAGYAAEAHRRATEIVVFDEQENAVTVHDVAGGTFLIPELPSTSRTDVKDGALYPQPANGASAGWMYLNLDHARDDAYASQNWVIASMRAQGRFSTDIESIALGNGCSAPQPPSAVTAAGGPQIAPLSNEAAWTTGVATKNNDDSCDIALLPAATLLLPYFAVDLDDPAGETTLFTVTNVGAKDQIARVTLWTDGGYPVITFNVFLTGYDVQAINLYDVLARGIIAPDGGTGTRVRPRGEHSQRNMGLDLADCRRLPGTLPAEAIVRMRDAFTRGRTPEGCNTAGRVHEDAVGYATIDVVRACTENAPTDAAYWIEDILYDNVLIGDVQQAHPRNNFAQGSPLVHIRAIPEGGTPASRGASPFQHTFYGRHQSADAPRRDGRQPLPSTFAARWIHDDASTFRTSFKIWREARSGLTTCTVLEQNTRLEYVEIVRFDEAENATSNIYSCRHGCYSYPSAPPTGLHDVDDSSVFPRLTNGAIAGWMYLNLDNDVRDMQASSNWVVTSMRAQGRHSVDTDAPALGNGCSAPIGVSELAPNRHGVVIGPARNVP